MLNRLFVQTGYQFLVSNGLGKLGKSQSNLIRIVKIPLNLILEFPPKVIKQTEGNQLINKFNIVIHISRLRSVHGFSIEFDQRHSKGALVPYLPGASWTVVQE